MDRLLDLSHYDDYIKSGCWKCNKSPSGAHYWIERNKVFICRWCGDVKKFPLSFGEAMKGHRYTDTIYPLSVKGGDV